MKSKSMKHIAPVVLMLNFGVAGAIAQQQISVKMSFSGTSAPSTVNLLQPGTSTGEENFAGSGTLGQFTLRDVSAETTSPQPQTSSCSGPAKLHFLRTAGAAVLRFEDGSLLNVSLTQGDDCVDLVARQGSCTLIFKIAGGTGRFLHASGILTLTETVVGVLADATSNPVFFTSTGEITGIVSGVAREDKKD
jgi:hypothetical protein